MISIIYFSFIMADKKWTIDIDRHRGFSPKYYTDTYPSFGNRDQASDMRNISLINPNVMTQGPGMAELTAGDQAGAVTTLIKGILRHAVSTNLSFAVGGAKLFSFSATAVANAGIWPHTISDDGSELGEDVCYYQGALYYSYNQTGSIGTIGKYDLATTFDDDYWDTGTPAAADLASAPHQMINGGDDVMYVANGQYIATLDGTTGTPQGVDFWANSEVASISWNYNRVLAAVNRPNLTGVNVNQSGVYRWDGFSVSWEGDPIEVNGRIGALYTKNGITYIWYEEFEAGTARLKFGMISGGRVEPIRSFSGSLPLYYQVGEMADFVIWLSGQRLYAFGPLSGEIKADMFQIMSPQYATSGGVATPFGKVLIASNATTNYSLEVESGYATDAYYYTLFFPTSKNASLSQVDKLEVNTNLLATGAKVNITIGNNQGTWPWTDEMSFATDGAVTKKTFFPRCQAENLSIQYSFSNGSATNPVGIESIHIEGRNISSG